ncbi:hypothetical protein SLEP1_g59482 [Rubroshorea leprosula]|uniref:Uncharacterized protein n=1 Tax=Rubroshorea leprosula TaxID=152421 RepID=A0AAV5MWJ5_9ROSI|nr:hypothetical protein SLEP1_g59482 [Rubroshorea leprosula]
MFLKLSGHLFSYFPSIRGFSGLCMLQSSCVALHLIEDI